MASSKSEIKLDWLPAVTLDLIPLLKIEFAPPPHSVVDGLKNATIPVVEIPISGKCPGVIDGLECEVTWKKKTGEDVEEGSSVAAKMEKTADGVFRIVDESGKNLTVDIFAEKLIGKGTFGYSVKPLLPKHSAVDHFPSGFSFENILDLEMPTVSSVRIGQKIALQLKRTGVFTHSDIRLLVAENDEGENENRDAVGVQHTWKQGDDEEWTWTVGFADTGYSLLTYPEPDEKGSYEYNFTLFTRGKDCEAFKKIKTLTNFVKNIKKPELSDFRLEYESGLSYYLYAKGTIKYLAPETRLKIGAILTKNNVSEDEPIEKINEDVCIDTTDENGAFAIELDSVFWKSSKLPIEEHMALLYLPQMFNPHLHKNQICAPVSWVMEYDDSKYAGFNGREVVAKSEGTFVCSSEGGGGLRYDFAKELTKFPESYHEKLKLLHKKHSKWEFYAKKCDFDFNDFIDMELKHGLVCSSTPSHGYSPKKTVRPDGGKYDPGWYGASKRAVQYFVDPRNFIDEVFVFQFLSTKYSESTQKASFVKPVLGGKLTGKENVFIKAGDKDINAIFLAAKAMVESGKGTSPLATGTVKGYAGYYNMYGIGATDGTAASSGAKKAKQSGWDTVDKAIIGGAKWIYDNYIEKHNQDTAYTLKWNIAQYGKTKKIAHQYATSIFSAKVKGGEFGKSLKDSDVPFVFTIPVFENMPDACPEPSKPEPR